MRRCLLACAVALVAVIGFATPAAAHATLQQSEPSDGARLDASPRRILLEFSERVEVALGGVRVFGAEGDRVDRGQLSHPNDRGSAVVLALPELRDGGYVVTWRVVSADSHPVQGAFTFTVGDAAPAEVADVTAFLDQRGGSRVVGVVYGVGRTVAFAALLVLLGTVAFVRVVWPAGAVDARFGRIAFAALALAGVATVANLGLQGGYAAGLGLGDALSGDVISGVLRTRFGRIYEIRLVLLAVAGGLLWVLTRRAPAPKWWPWAALAVGTAIAATPGLAGHAAVGTHEPYALIADVIHVGAAAVWLGGVVMLLATLGRVGFDTATAMAKRFSEVALYAVVVLVVTGMFQAYRQIGTIEALRTTEFGKLVVVKLLFVGAVLLVALASRRVVQRWSQESPRALRRTVTVEAAIAVGVLSVTALLVNAVPSKVYAATPQSGELTSATLLVDYTVSPGRAGPNDVHLYTLTKGGKIRDVAEMTLSLRQPARGVGTLEVPLVKAAPGHYQALDFRIPITGTWKLLVTARTSDIESEVFEATMEIR